MKKSLFALTLAVSFAGAAICATDASAAVVELADGRTIQGEILAGQTTDEGLAVRVFQTGGVVVVDWDLVLPERAKKLRVEYGIDVPDDEQFTDQESANKFYAQDVTFVLDMMTRLNGGDGHFAGAVDTKRTAAGGHSSGFPAVSGAAVVDKRIAALISFDSGVPAIVRREGLGVPVFLFRGEKDSYTDLFFRGKNVHPKGTIYTVDFFRVHRADFYDLVISGTTHSSVYDEYLFAETALERESYIRNHTIIAKYAVAYLDQVLKDIESPLLKEPSVDDPSTTLRVIPSLNP
jgi:hypothetical protein